MRRWFSRSLNKIKDLWRSLSRFAKVLIVSFIPLLLGPLFYVASYYMPTGDGKPHTYVVRKGTPFNVVVEDFARRDVVSWGFLLKLHGWIEGAGAKIIAGEYQFTPERSVASILEDLTTGHVVRRRFTAVEGKTSKEILEALRQTEGIEGPFPPEVVEATLWPETYFYTWGDSGADMIDRMQASFRQNTQKLWEGRDPAVPLQNLREALILASLVEKETSLDAERPLVASVFYNRLRINMPLQSDATVVYALWRDWGKPLDRELSRQDLLYDSPINTYRYRGLPSQPICNPGKASLQAVLHPAQSKALYFVADGTGGHIFADTLAEHQANHQKWRKIRDGK